MLSRHAAEPRIPESRMSVTARPTISALELLMPAACGRSLANDTSAPSGASGKLRASRWTTVDA
jgi:hypothetical protein